MNSFNSDLDKPFAEATMHFSSLLLVGVLSTGSAPENQTLHLKEPISFKVFKVIDMNQ